MNIDIKLNKDFERTLRGLIDEYGEDFEILNGIHSSQTNFSDFINAFVDKNVNDVTIDNNANASHKDIASLRAEKGKPQDKLIAANKIFYDMKKKYGLATAKDWLKTEYTGGFYLHDFPSTSFFSYCYAYDLTRLAKEGLFFLDKYNNKPAKHLSVFIDDVIEYISFMSNRSSGAVGLPNILVWTYYFHKKDVEDFEEEFEKCGVTNEDLLTELITYRAKKDLRQNFQKLIYRLNQPFMRIDQSAFVNVSIFDQSYYEALFGDLVFPDGSFAIDYIDDFIDHQKIFMDVVSTIRKENMFTFPVLTYSLLFQEEKFVNEDFARWCSDHNLEWNDSNFFVGQDVTTLSNCPLKGNTKILYWSDFYQEFKLSTIKEVYFNLQKQDKDYIEVLQNGKKIKCKINKFNESADYQIALVNGATITTTENHLNKVLNKDYVKTKDLTIDDYLPISLIPYEETNNLSYEDGKLVGMFLGEGSYRNQSEITYSLNKETDKDDIDFIKEYAAKRYAAKFTEYYCTSHISGNNLCVNLSVNSKSLRGLIEQFVEGSDALTKAISLKALSCSKEFRKGIIDGIYTTDGSKNVDETSNRLYTSSESLKDTLVILCASLGIATTVSIDDGEGRLGINPNYTIRFYTGRAKRKDVYITDDNYFWVKIKDITRTKKTEVAYCLEVIDDNVPQEFMLGNGIITHNCRLLSDTSKLKGFFNSIGGTELSIGSVKVNTINLVHMFYELGDQLTETKYLNLLKKRVLLCCKTLDTVRHIITRNIEKGLLPNYCEGGVDLKHQYCTVGILGLYETVEKFGYIATDEFGNKSYNDKGIAFAEKIFEVINEVKNSFTDEYSFNIESVPAERAAVNLCAKDSTLFNVRDYDIYSNQWIPLTAKCTINEKISLSSVLDKLCSGGAIAHINLENNFANKDMAWDMLNRIAQKGVFYFAFNTKINVCKARHAFIGTDICPECGQPVEDTWQRIVGFLTPTKSYSSARKNEFTARQWYDSCLIHGETSIMKD